MQNKSIINQTTQKVAKEIYEIKKLEMYFLKNRILESKKEKFWSLKLFIKSEVIISYPEYICPQYAFTQYIYNLCF